MLKVEKPRSAHCPSGQVRIQKTRNSFSVANQTMRWTLTSCPFKYVWKTSVIHIRDCHPYQKLPFISEAVIHIRSCHPFQRLFLRITKADSYGSLGYGWDPLKCFASFDIDDGHRYWWQHSTMMAAFNDDSSTQDWWQHPRLMTAPNVRVYSYTEVSLILRSP